MDSESLTHLEEAKYMRDFQARRINPDHIPSDLPEFQALVEREPNCALNWIAYMAYYVKGGSMPEAMAVGRRGLQVISKQEPNVRLHVWSAMLKLQAVNSSNVATTQLFQEAEHDCDTLKVYEVMADIYGDCGKFEEMESLLKKFTKKYSQEAKAWLMAGDMLYKYKLPGKAKALVDKGVLSIPRKKHVQYTSQYAEMLMKHGDIEAAKTVYEKLVGHFPKKINIWFVYIDKLTKHERYSEARETLSRMCYIGFNDHKMKTIFKKFTDFEKKHGTPYTLEDVKKRIENYCSPALSKTS